MYTSGLIIFTAICEREEPLTGTNRLLFQSHTANKGQSQFQIQRVSLQPKRLVIILFILNIKALVASLLTLRACVSVGSVDECWKNVACLCHVSFFVSSRSERKLYLGLWYLSY